MKKFAVDGMLRGTGKILRMMGFDTYIRCNEPFEEFLKRARREKRIVVTTRKGMGITLNELRNIIKKLEIKPLTRCLICNTPLKELSRDDVLADETISGKIPSKIIDRFEDFCICEICRRVYWEGTHADRMTKKIEKWLEEVGKNGCD